MKIKELKLSMLVLGTLMPLTLSSCADSEEVINPEIQAGNAPVSVHVNDFAISLDDFPGTRAAEDPSSYTDVKAITLAFYSGPDEVYKATQTKTGSSSFGNFSLSLPMGSYTMVVLGYDFYENDVLLLTSPQSAEFTSDHVRETFSYTDDVTISSTAAVSLSATLNRIVSELKIVSTDNKTSNASTVRTTFAAGGKAFNPSTGLATKNTGFSNTVGASQKAGAPTTSYNYVFLSSDEQAIDITIDVLDAEGKSISQRTLSDIPLRRNRVTTLRGALYTSNASTSFTLETSWLPDTEITF